MRFGGHRHQWHPVNAVADDILCARNWICCCLVAFGRFRFSIFDYTAFYCNFIKKRRKHNICSNPASHSRNSDCFVSNGRCVKRTSESECGRSIVRCVPFAACNTKPAIHINLFLFRKVFVESLNTNRCLARYMMHDDSNMVWILICQNVIYLLR